MLTDGAAFERQQIEEIEMRCACQVNTMSREQFTRILAEREVQQQVRQWRAYVSRFATPPTFHVDVLPSDALIRLIRDGLRLSFPPSSGQENSSSE